MTLKNDEKMYQMIIPNELSKNRYISGIFALNLPAPEETSGDWHFLNVFFRNSPDNVGDVLVAGDGEKLNTNNIWGDYGIYCCNDGLKTRGLSAASEKSSFAANHFRAILDLLYENLAHNKYPTYLQWASEDYLDTTNEKLLLLNKAKMMNTHLDKKSQELLSAWIDKESQSGYKA